METEWPSLRPRWTAARRTGHHCGHHRRRDRLCRLGGRWGATPAPVRGARPLKPGAPSGADPGRPREGQPARFDGGRGQFRPAALRVQLGRSCTTSSAARQGFGASCHRRRAPTADTTASSVSTARTAMVTTTSPALKGTWAGTVATHPTAVSTVSSRRAHAIGHEGQEHHAPRLIPGPHDRAQEDDGQQAHGQRFGQAVAVRANQHHRGDHTGHHQANGSAGHDVRMDVAGEPTRRKGVRGGQTRQRWPDRATRSRCPDQRDWTASPTPTRTLRRPPPWPHRR